MQPDQETLSRECDVSGGWSELNGDRLQYFLSLRLPWRQCWAGMTANEPFKEANLRKSGKFLSVKQEVVVCRSKVKKEAQSFQWLVRKGNPPLHHHGLRKQKKYAFVPHWLIVIHCVYWPLLN